MNEEKNMNEEVNNEVADSVEAAAVAEETLSEVALDSTNEATSEKKKKAKKKNSWQREVMEWVFALVIAVAVGLFLNNFVFTLVQVSGPSMENTLQDGDRLFLLSRHISKPTNGDIVVFYPENDNKPYIKRVIATEGQTVEVFRKLVVDDPSGVLEEELSEIDYLQWLNSPRGRVGYYEQRVKVDGKLLEEKYVKDFSVSLISDVEYPITIKKGHIFVMGDNRPNSHDSRMSDVEQVNLKQVRGKVLFRWWPFDKLGGV